LPVFVALDVIIQAARLLAREKHCGSVQIPRREVRYQLARLKPRQIQSSPQYGLNDHELGREEYRIRGIQNFRMKNAGVEKGKKSLSILYSEF
jgi:hypothetical protein